MSVSTRPAPATVPDTAVVHDALSRARARLVAADAAIVRTQVTLAEIPAPTGEEEERAVWVSDRFRALQLDDVAIDAAGNVVGRRGRSPDAPVVVCAHLDTVFPRGTELAVRRDGSRLYGPSINDNSRGLAVMLALAEVLGD